MSDEDQAGDVARAFGVGAPAGPLEPGARGSMGRVWKLRTERGTYAAKQLFAWARGEERLGIEARVVNAAIEAGIATPAMIPSLAGGYVATIGQTRWRLFAWADLDRPAEPPLTAAEAGRIGAVMAGLHRLNLEADAADVIPWFTNRPPETRWRALASKVREARPPWAGLLRDALPSLLELAATALPADSLDACLISHCDLNAGNVFFQPGGPILIDWEHAGAIPPAWELGGVIQAWAMNGDGEDDAETARAILTGYRDAGGRAQAASLAMFAGAISAHLNWTMGQVYRAVTDADPGERALAVQNTSQLISHPITRRRLEGLVAALSA